MSNLCSNKYYFYSADDREESKEALKKFYEDIEIAYRLEKENCAPNRRSAPSLKRLLQMHGIDAEKIFCRADFDEPEEFDGKSFILYSESAWSPTPEVFLDIFAKDYLDKDGKPLIKMVYGAEELGMGIFYSTDVKHIHFEEEIKIDLYAFKTAEFDAAETYEYVSSKDEAVKAFEEFFSKIYGKKENYEEKRKMTEGYSFDEWVQFFEDLSEDNDCFISVTELEFDEPEPLPQKEKVLQLLGYSKGQFVYYRKYGGQFVRGTITNIDSKTGKAEIKPAEVHKTFTIDPGKDGYFIKTFDLPKEKSAS